MPHEKLEKATIPLPQAANLLGIGAEDMRAEIRQGLHSEYARAYLCEGGKYRYEVRKKALENYLEGKNDYTMEQLANAVAAKVMEQLEGKMVLI